MNVVHGTIEYREILMSVWDRREKILYGNGSVGKVNQNNPTPKCKLKGTECYDD